MSLPAANVAAVDVANDQVKDEMHEESSREEVSPLKQFPDVSSSTRSLLDGDPKLAAKVVPVPPNAVDSSSMAMEMVSPVSPASPANAGAKILKQAQDAKQARTDADKKSGKHDSASELPSSDEEGRLEALRLQQEQEQQQGQDMHRQHLLARERFFSLEPQRIELILDGIADDGDNLPRLPHFTLHSGYFAMQGRRPNMEDYHTLLQYPKYHESTEAPDDAKRSFFAVYDGHGGTACAEFCSRKLHSLVTASTKETVEEKLTEAIETVDKEFCSLARSRGFVSSSGTTVLIAYFVGDDMYIANVGDSRAVLSSTTHRKGLPLSFDHKPNRKDEKKRILDMGGLVGRNQVEAQAAQTRSWFTKACVALFDMCPHSSGQLPPYRVYPGGLAISRSVGDLEMKASRLVICTPEVIRHRLCAEDEFMILACDGLWDVLSNADAVRLVRRFRQSCGEHPSQAARHLANVAYAEGSTDNISVIVVFFSHEQTNPSI